MTVRVWHTPTGWYWRGESVNCCGPFETAAQATADALRLDLPPDEFFTPSMRA